MGALAPPGKYDVSICAAAAMQAVATITVATNLLQISVMQAIPYAFVVSD